MLKTRAVTPNDLNKIQELHDKFYSHIEFPDFKRLLCGFVIEDENDEIVLAGGTEMMGEALLVTNKDKSRIKIGRALVVAQGAFAYTCQHFKIRRLHTFTLDAGFARHLVQHGFDIRDEIALRMEITDGQQKENNDESPNG